MQIRGYRQPPVPAHGTLLALVAKTSYRHADRPEQAGKYRISRVRQGGPEDVDPGQIPIEHRERFLEEIEGVILSDGEIAPEESENFKLLRELLI